MDEFKPDDELKPDTSDRRPQRQPRTQRLAVPSLALSRQHLMIGIGIVVLVLLIIGVGSALQSPAKPAANTAAAGNGEKNIDLSGSSSALTPNAAVQGSEPVASSPNSSMPSQPQTLNAPPISGTPTDGQMTPVPAGQQRVELPGNMTDALSSQQDKVNAFSQGATSANGPSTNAPTATSGNHPVTSLPTAPATLSPAAKTPAHTADKAARDKAAQDKSQQGKTALTSAQKVPMVPGKANAAVDKATVSGQSGAIQNAPASHFTLQLSSASRSDTLKAYAKQYNLPNAWVYETKRDGKPWYVLVNGVYASSAQAKQAMATLPTAVQAQKPWVKPIRQVKQDLNK